MQPGISGTNLQVDLLSDYTESQPEKPSTMSLPVPKSLSSERNTVYWAVLATKRTIEDDSMWFTYCFLALEQRRWDSGE